MSHSAKLVSPKRLSAGLSLLVACVACSGSDGSLSGEGAGASANGGAAGSGGSAGAGSVGSGTGGATGAGGTTGSSGDTAAGGTTIIGGEADGESPEGAAGGAGNRDGGGNGVGDANTGGNRNTGGSTNTGGNGNTGGSRNTGGTTNTGGSANTGGAGGGPSTTACGVNPITPNASQQTKNLLCYLYSIKGNHVLSGQQEANWNANPTDIAWYSTNLGKFPAVLGSDFLYRGNASCSAVTPSTQRAIAYWNAGGIAMFR
ncbi:MAG TPA: glycosyl hydrolase, partial [Polyangiaceae bacterium]